MKKHNSSILFLSFFLTTAITFALITIPSYFYWSRGQSVQTAFIVGGAGAVLFGIIYATFKMKTLNGHELELDFSALGVDGEQRICKELRRLGYREQDGTIYIAGFRADYYMAPDIHLKWQGETLVLSGPKFYLTKLFKRHRRFRRVQLRKIGQLTDTEPS
ncbi:hypothetical protein KKF84_14465 [Myxococcota bacterium]|nr:hypothetical protein [Myxococcota bacterium]MBU1536525.1 hypothetical protein [Myxococcota bacterium]